MEKVFLSLLTLATLSHSLNRRHQTIGQLPQNARLVSSTGDSVTVAVTEERKRMRKVWHIFRARQNETDLQRTLLTLAGNSVCARQGWRVCLTHFISYRDCLLLLVIILF